MSNCTFQAQLVSIMEILAKAAVAEINRRVNDSCAVIRLEVRRSQRDIDALKRKYHLMDNELRKTRGRARKKVPMCVTSDRYTPTPRSVCIQDRASVWSEEHTIVPEQRQPPPVQDPHLRPSDAVPLIKEETEEDNLWVREGDQVTYSLIGPDGTIPAGETKASLTPLDGQHDTSATHTSQQSVGEQEAHNTLEVQVKAEEEDDGERNEEEEKKEERSEGEATGEQQQQQGLGQGEFGLEHHGTPVWTTTTNDFSTETYSHTQPLSVPPPPPALMGSAAAMEHSGNSAVLMARNAGHVGWGIQEDGQACNADHVTREPSVSRPQLGFRAGGGPALGLGSYRGNSVVGGFSNGAATGFHAGALRRLRAQQWRSVGVVGSSSASSSTSSSLSCAERRVYGCSFCPKSFARLSQLKEHLRSHTGEKPFSCATCGRRFTKHCNLVRHAVVHSGEKPYRCPTCAKCFTQSSSLKSHQRTHLLPHREGALLSGPGTSQGYRGFT